MFIDDVNLGFQMISKLAHSHPQSASSDDYDENVRAENIAETKSDEKVATLKRHIDFLNETHSKSLQGLHCEIDRLSTLVSGKVLLTIRDVYGNCR